MKRTKARMARAAHRICHFTEYNHSTWIACYRWHRAASHLNRRKP